MSLMMQFQTLYKFEVKKKDAVIRESGWSPNVVLTQGLEKLATNGIPRIVSIGTGVTPPTKSDTILENQIASVEGDSNIQHLVSDVNVEEGYFYQRLKFQFGEGEATGNITEVGLGKNTEMFSRSLIRDARGAEAVVTVLEDEALDVIVELRCYINKEMTQSSIFISNELYQCRVLPYLVSFDYDITRPCTAKYIYFYEGSLVNSTTAPERQGASNRAYPYIRVTNDILPHTPYSRQEAIYLDLKTGNGRNLRTLIIQLGFSAFQIEYTPMFPKTSDTVLKLIVNYTWGHKE